MTRKIVVEGIGTFFLMFTIGMVVLPPDSGALGPVAIGAVLMAMIYAGGHISGAHYNPAVTVAVFIRGKATIHELIGYIVLQVVAASAAAMVVLWLKGGAPLTLPDLAVGPIIAVEFIFTFALAYVVLNVATARGVEGNSYYGTAIGLTVIAGAYAVGPISGGAFNPAVSIGSLVMGGIGAADIVLYLIAQVLAGAAAGAVFNAFNLGDDKPTTATLEEQDRLVPPGEPGL
jgi:aquaporin Z